MINFEAKNNPTNTGYFYLENMQLKRNGPTLQYAHPYRANLEDIYFRSRYTTWTPWYKILTTKNFGKKEIEALGLDFNALVNKPSFLNPLDYVDLTSSQRILGEKLFHKKITAEAGIKASSYIASDGSVGKTGTINIREIVNQSINVRNGIIVSWQKNAPRTYE